MISAAPLPPPHYISMQGVSRCVSRVSRCVSERLGASLGASRCVSVRLDASASCYGCWVCVGSAWCAPRARRAVRGSAGRSVPLAAAGGGGGGGEGGGGDGGGCLPLWTPPLRAIAIHSDQKHTPLYLREHTRRNRYKTAMGTFSFITRCPSLRTRRGRAS